MNDQNRANQFLRIFNELTDYFEKKNRGMKVGFTSHAKIQSRKDPVVKRYLSDLLEYAELRNAIIHHHMYPDEIIAEPTERMLDKFEFIARQIINPNLVYPIFKKSVRVFREDEPLSLVLEHLLAHDYNLVVIRRQNRTLDVLTSRGITLWLANNMKKEKINVDNVMVNEALQYEKPGRMLIIGKKETVQFAREIFDQTMNKPVQKIYALIITHDGKLDGEPVGLITPWDILNQEYF